MTVLISHQNELPDGTITGGEPDPDDLDALKSHGFVSLISLRDVGESLLDANFFESHGFQFKHLPVSGPGDLMGDFVQQFDDALKSSKGKTVVFCATGNRVGAAFAIHAHAFENKGVDAALEIGKQAGLTRLEGFVRQYLTLE